MPQHHVNNGMFVLNYKERQIITLSRVFLEDPNNPCQDCCGNFSNLQLATNIGADPEARNKTDTWRWLFRHDVKVKNFTIQSAFFVKDKLVIFAHGQPVQFNETFSSFLMVFDLVIHDGFINMMNPNCQMIRLNNSVHCEPNVRPVLRQFGQDLIIRIPQVKGEDDVRKLVELKITNGDFKK